MTPSRFALLLLLLGGLSWLARMGVDLSGGDAEAGAGKILFWVGAALLTLGTAIAAFLSVSHAPVWLQGIVGVFAPVALWMMLLAGNDMVGADNAVAAGIFGVLLAVGAAVAYVRSRPETKHRGARAAH